MYLQSSQSLNLISRQTVRLGAKPLVLVCAKELAQAVAKDVLGLVLAVALAVAHLVLAVARLSATTDAMSVATAVARRTAKTLALMDAWAGVCLVAWDTVLARFKTIYTTKTIMFKKEIRIHQEDSNLIERKFFEHAAGRDNIAFLMKDKEVNKELLREYIADVEVRFYELEKTKSLLSKKYEPSELKGKPYNYSFNFDEETILYEETR